MENLGIVGQFEVVLTIRFQVPPGQSPEDAGKQVANAGAMIPIGLTRFIRRYDVNVVPVDVAGPKLL